MKIGTLAKKSGIPVETIRYYEKEGLLPEPQRNESNYRIYEAHHLERLLFLRNCRAFDMTHEEIHDLLNATKVPEESCDAVNAIVTEHIGHIEARIEELKSLKTALIHLQNSCQSNHAVEACTIIEGLNSMHLPAQDRKKTHL